MKSFIIIPFYNKWDLTHSRLAEVYRKCPMSSVVLIDDASTDSDCKRGASFWQKGPFAGRLHYYANKVNSGFGASMNMGAKIARKHGADLLLFLSNDVAVGSHIDKEAETQIAVHKGSAVLLGAQFLWHDTGWNNLEGCGVVPYLNGWLLACTISTWDLLGGFDPIYGKFDFEDVDLSTMAWYKNVKLDMFPASTNVRHIGGQTVNTFNPGRVGHTKKNQVLWQTKWADRAKELRANIYGN